MIKGEKRCCGSKLCPPQDNQKFTEHTQTNAI
jgi:hypothetical protein